MQLRSRQAWRVLVPVVCLVAGFGFAASARDSRGTDLRPPGTANLRDLGPQDFLAHLAVPGIVAVTIFNPAATQMEATYEQLDARFLKQNIGGGNVPIVRIRRRKREIDCAARGEAQPVGERRHSRNDLDRDAERRPGGFPPR